MKKETKFKVIYKVSFILLVLISLLTSCDDESEEGIKLVPPSPIPDTIQNLRIEDIGDSGNARDLLVRFDQITDESIIDGYEIIVVQGDGEGFDLEDADNVPNENLTFIEKNASDIEIQLSEDATDSDGNLIQNNIDYTIFVVSVGIGDNAVGEGQFIINALSEGVNIRLE